MVKEKTSFNTDILMLLLLKYSDYLLAIKLSD